MKNGVVFLFLFLPLCASAVAFFPPAVTPPRSTASPIRDMNNREIPFAPPAQRVVIFPPILSDYATIDQGVSHVVGTSRPNATPSPDGLTWEVFPEESTLPVTGRTVDPSDPEIVIRMKPDAVFVWSHVLGSLNNLGFPALFEVRLVQGNQGRQLEMWRLMGRVAGRNERAEMLLAQYLDKLKSLRALLPPKSSHPLRVAILNASKDGWWIASGRNYYLNMNLEWANARNAADNVLFPMDRGDILERLLTLDPDIILLNCGGDHGVPQDIYQVPQYRSIRAVRERRVYLMPAYMDASMVVKDHLLLLWMAEIFYPGQMARLLRQEYVKTYQSIYGYALKESQIDRVIFLKDNLGSAGYIRFANRGERGFDASGHSSRGE